MGYVSLPEGKWIAHPQKIRKTPVEPGSGCLPQVGSKFCGLHRHGADRCAERVGGGTVPGFVAVAGVWVIHNPITDPWDWYISLHGWLKFTVFM